MEELARPEELGTLLEKCGHFRYMLQREKTTKTVLETRFVEDKKTGERIAVNVSVQQDIEELIFYLKCKKCGKICGEKRFPLDHGRVSDEALEAEQQALYTTYCDTHSV